MSAPAQTLALHAHPDTAATAVRALRVAVARAPADSLALIYILEGDLDQLRIPERRPPRVTDKLWEHTCAEAFIARPGAPAYDEFNFSPSSEWAVYRFARYRERLPLDTNALQRLQPTIRIERSAQRLELHTSIDLACLSPAHASGPLRVALSAVIEDRTGTRSYWALRHPPGKPDFHHTDAFALELDAIRH